MSNRSGILNDNYILYPFSLLFARVFLWGNNKFTIILQNFAEKNELFFFFYKAFLFLLQSLDFLPKKVYSICV